MSALNDICVCSCISGIQKFWYIDASKVTNAPDACLPSLKFAALTTSSALQPVNIESGTGTYAESENINDHGPYFDLEVAISQLLLTPEKDDALLSLAGRRLLIFFKDNNGNYRFIMNARKRQKAGTEAFISGKNHYAMAFALQSRNPAWYFTGTVTEAGDGSITLS